MMTTTAIPQMPCRPGVVAFSAHACVLAARIPYFAALASPAWSAASASSTPLAPAAAATDTTHHPESTAANAVGAHNDRLLARAGAPVPWYLEFDASPLAVANILVFAYHGSCLASVRPISVHVYDGLGVDQAELSSSSHPSSLLETLSLADMLCMDDLVDSIAERISATLAADRASAPVSSLYLFDIVGAVSTIPRLHSLLQLCLRIAAERLNDILADHPPPYSCPAADGPAACHSADQSCRAHDGLSSPTPAWCVLSIGHLPQVLGSDYLRVSSELGILSVIGSWLCSHLHGDHEGDISRCFLPVIVDLLKCVRWKDVSATSLPDACMAAGIHCAQAQNLLMEASRALVTRSLAIEDANAASSGAVRTGADPARNVNVLDLLRRSHPAHTMGRLAGRTALICAGGFSGDAQLASCEGFIPSLQSWVALPELQRGRAEVAGAVIDETPFVIGGCVVGHDRSDAVECFSRVNRAWSQGRSLPVELRACSAAVCRMAGQPVLAVCGVGQQVSSTSHLFLYGKHEDRWRSVHVPFNVTRSTLSSTLSERSIVAIGGHGGVVSSSFVHLLDYGVFAQPGPNMLHPRESCGAALCEGRVVVTGGWKGPMNPSLPFVEWLDMRMGRWMEGPKMRTARRWHGTVFHDGKLYAFGGRGVDASNDWLSSAEMWDVRMNEWMDISPMTSARGGPASVVATL
jgi:hypothetical protein